MFGLKQLVVLALVGSTFASPLAHGGWSGRGRYRASDDAPEGRGPGSYGYNKDKYVVVVGTTTEQDPATTTVVVTPVTTTPAVSTSTGTTTPVTSTNTGYMAIVDKWRAAMGKPLFKHDDTLEANAIRTAREGNGKMKHQLFAGSMGQVLAPGDPSSFENVFVGGWLCEREDLPGLNGICATMGKGWAHGTETGHADILSGSYTKIGCGNVLGIWACDVA